MANYPATRVICAGLLLMVSLAAGELTARIDDYLSVGLPPWSSTSYDGLFYTLGDGIRRGRPGARWKQVRMNNVGMRGPDLDLTRDDKCDRWLFLGASETFGEPGTPDSDFPSVVRRMAGESSCVEVANSASPGLNLRNSIEQYDAFGRLLAPTVVFIYPPTHFYLADQRPRRAVSAESRNRRPTEPPPSAPELAFVNSVTLALSRSRLVERLLESAEVPGFVQRMRIDRWIEAELRKHPHDWAFSSIPAAALDSLEGDLKDLAELVRSSGARPVFITHAVRTTLPPEPPDIPMLRAMRRYVPRADGRIVAAFEYAAAQRMRELGARIGVDVVDVASSLSGQRELFIDLVHLSPEGNRRIAVEILKAMRTIPTPAKPDALQ